MKDLYSWYQRWMACVSWVPINARCYNAFLVRLNRTIGWIPILIHVIYSCNRGNLQDWIDITSSFTFWCSRSLRGELICLQVVQMLTFLKRKSPKADENIRNIKADLVDAVDCCIEAAGFEFHHNYQRSLLKVSNIILDIKCAYSSGTILRQRLLGNAFWKTTMQIVSWRWLNLYAYWTLFEIIISVFRSLMLSMLLFESWNFGMLTPFIQVQTSYTRCSHRHIDPQESPFTGCSYCRLP